MNLKGSEEPIKKRSLWHMHAPTPRIIRSNS